jgi:hypothetical protein
VAGDPFREQRFEPEKVRRILRKAAALAESDRDTAGAGRALTGEEIERTAGELGIPASAVTAAMHDDAGNEDDDDDATPRSKHSWFIGAPTRIVLEETVAGEPSEEDCEDIIEEISGTLGSTGALERVGKTLVWHLSPGYRGRGRDLSIRIRSRDGKTRILIEERLTNPATGLFVGIGVGAGIGPMGGYIAAMVKLGVVGLVFPILWIPLMLVLARTIYGALSRRRERSLREVMRKLKRSSAGWSAPKVRVASEAATNKAADDEAEAEEEASAAAVARRSR